MRIFLRAAMVVCIVYMLSMTCWAATVREACFDYTSSTQYGYTRADFSVSGYSGFVILPAADQRCYKMPWVWYAPTFIGSLPSGTQTWVCQALLAQGIAICGVDVGESYGSPTGRAAFSEFHKYIVSKFKLSAKACLWAQSRGGLMLINWASEHPDFVKCIVGTYPVCDLTSYPGLATAAPAYGMAEAALRSHLTEHNPIDRLTPLAAHHVPFYIRHGDSDTLVPLEANSAELKRRYEALGGPIQLVIVPGKGHEEVPEFFQSQEMVDYLVNQAKN